MLPDDKQKWMVRGVVFAIYAALAIIFLLIAGVIVLSLFGAYWLVRWTLGW
jgi:uncharacterized membrane protein HdeD (DUF308 family)